MKIIFGGVQITAIWPIINKLTTRMDTNGNEENVRQFYLFRNHQNLIYNICIYYLISRQGSFVKALNNTYTKLFDFIHQLYKLNISNMLLLHKYAIQFHNMFTERVQNTYLN